MPNPDIVAVPEVPADPVPAPHYTVFHGPNGIRAGWRCLIFLALVAGFFATFIFAIRIIMPGQGPHTASQLTPGGTAISSGLIFIFPAIAALIMAQIEHRKFGDYGLPLRYAFRSHFWVGTFAGFAAISVCLLGIFLLHGFRVTGLAIHGNLIWSSAAAWTGAFILVGLAEEFAFRGYLQYTLTTGIGFWPSAILLSLLFALAHGRNPGETAAGLLAIPVFALVFCLVLRRTGNLWWAVGFHAGWDWGQTFFYGVADSGLPGYHNLLSSSFSGPRWLTGGTVGPEASVFTPIVLILVGIVFARIYRENKYPASNLEPQTSV